MLAVRKQRKILRGKMTRTINRLSDYIELKVQNPKRFERELETLRVDFSNICIVHGELYEYVEEHEHPKLDEWESELISAMNETEDKVEHYLELQKGHTHEDVGGNIHSKDGQFKDQISAAAVDTSQNLDDSIESSEENHGPTNMEDNHSVPARVSGPSNLMLGSTPTSADQTVFDKWIVDLVEFEETKFPNIPDTMSISEALYKLEAAKDIPTITLKKFDGNPLEYVDFVERFRIHIHEKAHLTDDVRMAQLLMHLHGDASRAVSPLGSSGIMYATALKLLKDQFGHPSLIARSFINKLVNGSKIVPNNRNSLKDLSLDLIASIATLKRLNYFADVNSNDILRKIIARLPSHLIDKWKVVAADLREKGEVPSVIHISDFVRKRFKAEFDPDFGDIDKSRVVRALFRAPNGRICQGNVLIDGGAGTTIIRKGFSIALGLQGKVECLDISVVGGGTVKQSNSRRVHCKLSSLEGGEEFDIEAFELDNTVEDVPNLDKAWLKSFSYLRDIEFSCKGGPIDLILGVQYSHIHADEEIRQGLPFEPVAKRSKLGWYVMGADTVQRVSPVCAVQVMQKVDFQKMYDFETLGIQAPNCQCPREIYSSEDRKALDMLASSCQRIGNRYEIGLPWKRDPQELPNNYSMAEKRLYSLERGLLKNEAKASLYSKAISEYVEKGFAVCLEDKDIHRESFPVYYLPHHGVYRPDKPSTPLRVVFDPASEFQGVSLNSFLYRGPCMIGDLYGVLIRFREDYTAVVGDISKMYLQILLPESDTDVHRYLWRDLDTSRKPDVYKLLRVAFGDKPSPNMASYVMLRIASENKNSHPDGAVILERDRYMDDLIHSCPSDDIAVERVRQVDDILASGSFQIKKWYSSSVNVLNILEPNREHDDASVRAYGAVAYQRWETSRGYEIGKEFSVKFQRATKRCEIVYYWVQAESVNFKQFVGVRIAEIQFVWKPEQWRFVPSDQNPADDLSRGISVEEINGRWMHGPDLLRLDSEQWPKDSDKTKLEESALEKRNSKVVTFCDTSSPVIDPERFSNWSRLVRVTGYCLRFIDKLHAKVRGQAYKHPGPCLQPEEINGAETYWVKFAQQSLGNWKTTLTDLAPFERDGVIRAGGRLRQTSLQYDQVHPIILPAKHQIAKLIMRDVHEKLCHVGPERTLSESRRKYWIIRGRSMAKGIVKNCVTCKLRQPVHQTLMSDLPAERLYPFLPPFTVTGVDLFGPFKLKYGRNKSIKAWGAIFSCASVRAIHLEIVADLSTQAFLQALRRFAAHHGWPQTIISDNGTSFVGAKRELKVLLQEGRKQIEKFAVLHKLKWKFITPLSPHQGGLYESLIKQVKCALQVVVGQQLLSWDEMSTVFAEVECLVNSRPLTKMSSDPNDLQPITPNNFVLGRASTEIPQGPFQEMTNLQKRFKFVQCLVQQVWKRFLREYVPTLMKRVKWQAKGRQLQVGDMVLLVDINSPRGKWDLARILEVFPGKDGIVRNVKVKTSSGVYQRSVQKCCLILEENSSSQ
ncbi:uncharacterized protein [Haliotis asinina]|uniref:uncharacterized protein n=1 Tax=Haliotis asinina TaxID=109174 RepID=UPI003532249A